MDPVHARERAFWDARAADSGAADRPPRPPDDFELSLLDALGPVEGLDLLEVGCGTGDLSLELLRRGARLTALDLSPVGVELTAERAARYLPAAELRTAVVPVDDTGLRDDSFDRVVGKWILHHVDIGPAAREIHRVLRPGGRAAFFENQDRNPVLRFARRRLTRLPGVHQVGTADEHPLTRDDFALLAQTFDWMRLAYPNLYFLEALGRALGHRGMGPLQRADKALWRRVPRLRPLSWHVLVTVGLRNTARPEVSE
jgi:SAM-dependent methyltransferase